MLYATHAVVDLAALRHNMAQIRQLVGERKILIALKADGYGHGAVAIAHELQAHGLADMIGVATTPEGIQLREAGINLPILRLSPVFVEELPAALDADLSLVVHDRDSIQDIVAVKRPATVHLAIDTGMHRLGCRTDDAPELARMVADAGLQLAGVSTHLAIADDPAGEEFTKDQLRRFLASVGVIQDERAAAGLAPVPLVHASNSGAVLGHELAGLTMVRPGIACYGLYEPADDRFRPILELKTKISGIRRVPAGESVGYGRTWSCASDRWIATVPIGYADGYSRLLSNRGRMLVGGRSCPVVGRVCMDQTMINLGPADQDCPAKVGDEVVVIGGQGGQRIEVSELAAAIDTISYEVTCAINCRVPRIFINAAH